MCRVPCEMSSNMYQKLMSLSFDFDEKIGFELWHLPKKSK